jgi:hypothetical protein
MKQILGTGNQTINLLDNTQIVGKLQKKKEFEWMGAWNRCKCWGFFIVENYMSDSLCWQLEFLCLDGGVCIPDDHGASVASWFNKGFGTLLDGCDM